LEDDTFISQTKYTHDLLKKFVLDKVELIKTLMDTNGHLDLNMGGKLVDQKVAMPPTSSIFKATVDDNTVQIKAEDPTKTVQIGANLNPKYERDLVDFLRRNKDIFTWSPIEMAGISREVTEHTLNIKASSRPVKQGLRRFNQEKPRTMGKELCRLLAASFVKEVLHPDWIANPVLMPKKSGKWWMCVDYTSLNKACLKDPFPLRRIDQVIDFIAGCELLSFLDAYSGYQ
jgi:hypothetical protein